MKKNILFVLLTLWLLLTTAPVRAQPGACFDDISSGEQYCFENSPMLRIPVRVLLYDGENYRNLNGIRLEWVYVPNPKPEQAMGAVISSCVTDSAGCILTAPEKSTGTIVVRGEIDSKPIDPIGNSDFLLVQDQIITNLSQIPDAWFAFDSYADNESYLYMLNAYEGQEYTIVIFQKESPSGVYPFGWTLYEKETGLSGFASLGSLPENMPVSVQEIVVRSAATVATATPEAVETTIQLETMPETPAATEENETRQSPDILTAMTLFAFFVVTGALTVYYLKTKGKRWG